MDKKIISVVVPCYNEAGNVKELYLAIQREFQKLFQYDFNIIFIDNASTDRTVNILREMAKQDTRVKVIVNSRNFGWIRSPYYGLLQATGDAAIFMACDFQNPPELISQFIKKWEEGFKIVIGVRSKTDESLLMSGVRSFYYKLLKRLSDSDVELVSYFTGFGLYDKEIIGILQKIDDPCPLLRSIICEIGFEKAEVKYIQPNRKKGLSSGSFYRLYDTAILGITSTSKIPLRLATFIGFGLSFVSLVVSVSYLIAKLIFWNEFSMGIAPVLFGLFFFAAVQLFFIGIIGEYIGAIYTNVQNRPLVIEKERINFD